MCAEKEKLELQKQLTEIKLCQLEEQSSIKPITPDELIDLAESGQLTEQHLQTYLQNGGDINIQDQWGNTALIWASYWGHLEIVQLLVEKGADVDIQDNWGNTALIIASYWGHLEVVIYLVEKGAKIDIQNKDGWTALDLAKTQEIKNYLISK